MVERSNSTKHHANNEMGIMTEFAGEYARLKVVGLPDSGEKDQFDLLTEFVKNNPKSINIVCASSSPVCYTQNSYRNEIFKQELIDAANLSNVVFYFA